MKTRYLHQALAALCLALTSPTAHAHKVRFVAFDLPVPAGDCKLIPETDEKSPTAVELGISRFSKAVDVPSGPCKLVLPDGMTTGRINISGDAGQNLVAIVFPGPQGTVSIITTPDNRGSFAPGDRLFINAAKSDVKVQIGDKNFTCKPGTAQMVKPPGSSVDGRYPVRMGSPVEGEWKIFNSTWWPDDRTCRSIVLLYPNTTTGFPGVKTIEEIPASEEPPAK